MNHSHHKININIATMQVTKTKPIRTKNTFQDSINLLNNDKAMDKYKTINFDYRYQKSLEVNPGSVHIRFTFFFQISANG